MHPTHFSFNRTVWPYCRTLGGVGAQRDGGVGGVLGLGLSEHLINKNICPCSVNHFAALNEEETGLLICSIPVLF